MACFLKLRNLVAVFVLGANHSALASSECVSGSRSTQVKNVIKCRQLLDGNVGGRAIYSWGSFPVDYYSITTVHIPCDAAGEVTSQTDYFVDLKDYFSGDWNGPTPGPDILTMQINSPGQTVETEKTITTTRRLTGHKITKTTAVFDKQTRILELSTTEKKALFPKLIGHVRLQCE